MPSPTPGTSTTAGNATGTTLVINKPASAIDGDLCLAHIMVETSTTISAPAGWSQISALGGMLGTYQHRVYARVLSGDGSSWTWTWDGSTVFRSGSVQRYTGQAGTSSPIEADTSLESGTGTTATASTITTTTPETLLVMVEFDSNGATATPTGALVEFVDFNRVWVGSEAQAAAGASGSKAITRASSGDWVAGLIALMSKATLLDGAPTFVGAGTAATTATSGASLSPGLPTGWAANDIHLLVAHISSNDDLGEPSGWTKITPSSAAENNTALQRVEVWWRRAVGGDSAPTITGPSNTTVRGARVYGIRGCPTAGDPFAGSTRSNNAASATVTFATLTPSVSTTLLLAVYAYEDDPSAASAMAGWDAWTVATSSLGNDMAMGHATRGWTSGATGALTTTISGGTFANSANVGILLAFRSGTITRTVSPVTFAIATEAQRTISPVTFAITTEAQRTISPVTYSVQTGLQRVTTPVTFALVVYEMIPGTYLGFGGGTPNTWLGWFRDQSSVNGVYTITVSSMAEYLGDTPRVHYEVQEWAGDIDSPEDVATVAVLEFDEPGSAVLSFDPTYATKPFRVTYLEVWGSCVLVVTYEQLAAGENPR